MVELQSMRLRLEPLNLRHAAKMFMVLQDPSIYEYIDDQAPVTLYDLEKRYAILERGVSPSGSELWLNWVVLPSGEADAIGYVQATVEAETALIAYVFVAAARGNGYASEATQRMLEHLRSIGVREARAEVDDRNISSRRLLERLRFRFISEGPSTNGSGLREMTFSKRL